jgi:casein kinase 1
MSNNQNNKDNENFPYEIVFDKYKIEKKIGKGSFGTVFMATNKENHEHVAIKTEINNDKIQVGLLESEAHKLTILKGYLGIPKIYNFGKLKGFNVLAMELLGKSLTDIFSNQNKKFSLKTVCTIAIDMIKLIQHIHEKKIIHRDIKPDNFMMGLSKNKYVLYLIDFGLAKKYINSNGQHIPFKLGKSMTGTARYCSIYTHQGMEQSRRDDLESIGYVLMYFLRGDLPWQGIKVKENEKHYERIGNMKQSISIDELCAGFPIQFVNYFNYVKQLEFEDEPNYNLLIELFEVVLKKYCGVKYINPSNSHRENLFDWNHKNYNALPEKLKSKTSRNFTK